MRQRPPPSSTSFDPFHKAIFRRLFRLSAEAGPTMSSSSSSSSFSTRCPPTPRPFCRFFFQNGQCRNGDACRFSHDTGGSCTREMALKTIPCPYYASGSCRYGEYCELLHPNDDGGDDRGGGEVDDDDDDGGTRVCGICLEPPRSYGILSCCDHAFCYSCLMEWRKEGSSDVTSRRVCPTCRMSSDYVVPSPYMPADSDEKERLLREYRDRCSTIPCKKFELGRLGSCPFGRDCFYAHTSRDGKDIKSRDKSMQQLYETRQRERNDRDTRDIEHITDMLMMMGMQRYLARQDRGGRWGDGRGGRGGGHWGRDRRGDVVDEDSDDGDDGDEGDIFFSDVLAALLRDEPELMDLFTSMS
ncbi:hypothetical protein ACHAXA_003029 [Cyclostephanos tholiformis]|uniref:RING-type E3 ubiquitin transferase n=1 Tax=Cyclostephanos tholiformis TaxID=382380 RepID=A0ABD3RCZ2_9STRA